MTGYEYCAGCNTSWVDTGCGDREWHSRCPRPCGICGKPSTGRKGPDDCQSHSIGEARAHLAARLGRAQ